MDDPHAIVIANPPTYFSGYEKYYDTQGKMVWKEPEYELFDPETGHKKFYDMCMGRKALVICYQEKKPGEAVGYTIYARSSTRADLNAYITTNREEEATMLANGKKIKRPSESKLEPLECSMLPRDYEITENSKIQIISIKSAEAQYYRQLWTHNFVGSSATFNRAVLIDGMIAGVFGISKMQATSLFIWYVMKVPHMTYRLGRLLYMLAQNQNFINTILDDLEREKVTKVRTAMLTKYPENKEVRGIMKLVNRQADKNNGFKLTYEAEITMVEEGKTMAEEQSKKYEMIYDMGSGLIIAKVPLDKVKEQDINARIMKNEMQDQLTANIKNRGQLESLPFFCLVENQIEIISGHHRVKSARAAGMKEIIAILDVSGLTRSKIAAKQLAHNAISGFDDDSTLREIVKMIDDVDDMIESFISKDILEEPLEEYDKMASPAIEFDFKTVVFSFLPHQIKDLDALIKNLETAAPEIIGVATYEQCKEFTETLSKYQKFSDIRNVGAAIHSMVQSVNEKMDNVGYDENEEWTYLAKLFGSNAIPGEAANVIQQAIKKAEKKGTITSKNRWQLIEFLCADYLSGK